MLELIPAMVVMCVVGVLSLILLARMRVLRRVVDIVVRSYSIIARQRVSNAWVPPERTALDGRRTLDGKYLPNRAPAGLLLWRGLRSGRTGVS
jgi:hypothetical protein